MDLARPRADPLLAKAKPIGSRMSHDNTSAITYLSRGKQEKKREKRRCEEAEWGQRRRGGGAGLMGLAGLTLWPLARQPTGPDSVRPGCKKWRGDEK